MALPADLQNGLSPAEIEFISENELVTLIPHRNIEQLNLLQGTLKPAVASREWRAPLWLALTLRRRAQCRILPPDWLSVGKCRPAVLREEQDQPGFSKLPPNYMEIGHMLLESAADDIPQASMVRRLLKDLREVRQAKARAGLAFINGKHLVMDNIAWMELNEIRPFLTEAFLRMRQLEPEEAEGGMP
ncbi:hypothetical protein THASP1DRAFT_16617 [Thamnocephalis sphaerospora]|uniref:DNA replication complex GINS protein PSF2 n=1 Tax=Thamnocephalis sphaerospora TaxID=78915 RepID=A0A4P9XP24_9FUNG|nr:hypothetical protein THASP1DRAFT_16617 [Thamnocephalis sphaerospora]|eukprot:RKP07753.1 hypothetical protein THASP1DRAFT_16617 [Thamnocephalis sphaerospora]